MTRSALTLPPAGTKDRHRFLAALENACLRGEGAPREEEDPAGRYLAFLRARDAALGESGRLEARMHRRAETASGLVRFLSAVAYAGFAIASRMTGVSTGSGRSFAAATAALAVVYFPVAQAVRLGVRAFYGRRDGRYADALRACARGADARAGSIASCRLVTIVTSGRMREIARDFPREAEKLRHDFLAAATDAAPPHPPRAGCMPIPPRGPVLRG